MFSKYVFLKTTKFLKIKKVKPGTQKQQKKTDGLIHQKVSGIISLF